MKRYLFPSICCILLFVNCSTENTNTPVDPLPSEGNSHQHLVEFFYLWREFHSPEMVEGVPDYSKSAMRKRHNDLGLWKDRLQSFDTTGWAIDEQVDWYLILAEMNGLDFAHRVKRPWERDPAFYVWFYSYATDVPEREGPNIYGSIELPGYDWPLSNEDALEIAERLSNAPELYKQARVNLTGNARDLWVSGTATIRDQGSTLQSFAERVRATHPDLADAAEKAKEASDEFAQWLQSQSDSKTGISGVGKENYSWNLKYVHLLPYTWEEEVLLMERELARSHSGLRMMEHQNRNLPQLTKIDNATDFDLALEEAVSEYMAFLEEEEIMPIKDYLDPALRAQMGKFSPSEGMRGFFAEIGYRDALPMRTHHYHWFDLARMREEPNRNEIRRTPLLYNIFDGRAEGMATGMEELMMHAGLFEERPRAKELIYILLAQRAARGLGGLYQHGQEMTLEEACEYASRWVPWGLLPADGSTITHEEQFYLQQPAYGTSYVIGKLEIDKLIAEYARQREGGFILSEFMDDFNRRGLIPISLIYWEMTGDKSMLDKALAE